MKLYSYFRSSAAYRVRIALELKGLVYDYAPVHLLAGGGQQYQPAYREVNRAALVPTLEADGLVLQQSMAIIEYLDETHPEPALLPASPAERARVRTIAQAIACEIHPLNNLRVLKYLKHQLGVDDAAKDGWYRHWIGVGLAAVEAMLADDARTGRFCHGDSPTLADCCLVPQVFNAERFGCQLDAFPRILQVVENCRALPAFERAAPGVQPDAA